MKNSYSGKVLALCGGVGGAKLAWGLAQMLAPKQLTIAVNTGDDFEHFGLHISPDIDTVMYTLAGINNSELGWGLAGESWQCMEAMTALGGDSWFRLGDRDMATHLLRTQWLAQGKSLSEVTAHLCERLNIAHTVVPMSDDSVRTWVDTDEGILPFQHYFVRAQCAPVAKAVLYADAENAKPNPAILALLNEQNLRTIIICPSNPLLSIGPILALPGLPEAIKNSKAKVFVVSPLIKGQALKGPTAKMMRELAIPTDSTAIAAFYAEVADVLIIDESDANDADRIPIATYICKTLMKTDADKIALAREILARTRI